MYKEKTLPTLLIVSDNPSITFWLKKHLTEEFFLIDAKTEKETLEVIQNTAIDFIVIDSAIEGLDPLQLCKEIRNNTLKPPILLITGQLKKSYIQEALQSGATDFLNDNLDESELHLRIKALRKAVSVREKVKALSSTIPSKKAKATPTYLKNKILLHDQALRLLTLAHQSKIPLNLLVVQIDHFAQLTRKKEHIFIQELLEKTNKLISSSLNDSDLSIPSSNGKILILTQRDPRLLAAKLCRRIETHPFLIKSESIQITASIAISPIEANEEAFNQMIETATKALKKLKSATNQIIDIGKDLL